MDILRLTLRQLQIFVAVARMGSTTAASAEVSLCQSATSSAVNELERLLSMRLFDRAGKRLLLNDNGRALLPRALALLDGAAGIERMTRDGMEQAQSLRIGASTTIANYVLPTLLGVFFGERYQDRTTAWRSSVKIGNTRVICDAVAAFELDIGLIEGPSHQASLAVTPWLQDELIIVSSPDSMLAGLTQGPAAVERVSVKALRDLVWLLREPGSGTREATDQLLLPHLRSYRRSIEIGSSEAIKHAAAEGLGAACLSQWVVSDLVKSKRLRRIPTTLPKLTRQCYLVVHHDKQATPALLRFIAQATSFVSPSANSETGKPSL
ncbi:MAG: LysR family transcriptional regulator [Polaromonas sp.]|uniref:LysR family transcriptional regulator n=1 Tax=Polaromonas sp. TaxID=1869339 RepID=UPI0017A3F80B|nr:LysR family transcriptional regulator [Polaromonas sp.]NMM11076.1 LysR family transcriptional regulator [Polaromonas sp.]